MSALGGAGIDYEYIEDSDKYFRSSYKSMSKAKEMLPDFPYKKGVNMEDIQLTEEGKYSYTKRRDGNLTIDFLREKIGPLKHYSILDCTGNVGGDTILFGLHFKQVHSIEIDEENFRALNHNVSLYKFDNVHLHFGDSTKLFDKFATDIVYMDPPWGGPDYKTKTNLDVYLGKTRVDNFIKNDLLSDKRSAKERPKYIVLKLPFNYHWARLKDVKDIEETFVLRIRNYRILILKIKPVEEKHEKEDSKGSDKHEAEKAVVDLIADGDTFTIVKKKNKKRARSRSVKSRS